MPINKKKNIKLVQKKDTKIVNKEVTPNDEIINLVDKDITTVKNIISLNKGEVGEIYVIIYLYNLSKLKEEKYILLLIKLFGEAASNGITLCDLTTKEPINDVEQIKKSKSIYKADCLIKFNKTSELLYISIKCDHGAKPAILNHTPRTAKVFQENGELINYLPELDILVNKLNKERTEGNVSEDIHIIDIDIPDKIKECLMNVIKYFMFEGSGSGKNKMPANAVLNICNPRNIDEWKFSLCNTDETKLNYVKTIYKNIIISIREKGMPKKINKICEPWILQTNKKNKGAIHIRLKKNKEI